MADPTGFRAGIGRWRSTTQARGDGRKSGFDRR
jgi:hypothetical protein